MDTKARIGLFVGGLVLVGMVAYVMMPRTPAAGTEDSATTTDPSSLPDFAAGPSTQPTTQPVAITDPFAGPTASSTTPSGAPVVVPARLDPVDPSDPWRALDTGVTPAPAHSGSSLATHSSMLSQGGGSSAAPATVGAKTYRIQTGDTLTSISTKFYGSAGYTGRILAANPGVNPNRMKVGQELKLPQVNAADQTRVATVDTTTADDTDAVALVRRVAAAPTPSVSLSAAPTGATPKTYKVQAGDTLTKISTKVYGQGGMWKKLYAANKSKIGADPARLRAGMVLQIPDSI